MAVRTSALRTRDKVVVITGATSGVGRAVARAFGNSGACVGLIARGCEAVASTALEITAAGGEALELPLDLADADAVDAAADRVVHTWGAIDVWINNAMVSVFAPVSQTTAREYRRVTEVNYLGTVHGTLAALRHMSTRGAGTIVQVGSALAYRSIPLQSAYCASKAAIRGFTDSLRSELIHENSAIQITMLQLPAINTPQFDVVRNKLGKHAHPVPPLYQPELIADAILQAVEHPRRERWIGATTAKAIVGQRIIPAWLDRYLAKAAWESQTTEELPLTERDNLWCPLPGDRGAHGPFDDEARDFGVDVWVPSHGKSLMLVLAAAGTLALGAAMARRRGGGAR
jgi:NADP-dependent 3-hydroxy acid dehydrogenase YdfG